MTFDGFRFDTGPSWYFMPEVFEHLFALLGERVEDHLDLVRLDPAYRVFPEPVAGRAADRHHTETALLGAEHQSLPASWWADRGPGISSLLIMAGVRGELPELPHHSLFFTRD